VPSHKHIEAAKQREKEFLKNKKEFEARTKPSGGSGGSKGAQDRESKLQGQVAELQRQLADVKAKAAHDGGVAGSNNGKEAEGLDVLDARIARYEAAIAGLVEDGEADLVASYKVLLEKAKLQKANARAPSSKQQVLNEQKKAKAKLESRKKKQGELLELLAKTQSDLATVEEEITDLQGQMQKLDQKAQALAAEDAQKGSGAGLLDYVQALKGSCAKRLGSEPGFDQCIQQLEKCAQQIHTELQKAEAKEEAKRLEEAKAEAALLPANASNEPRGQEVHEVIQDQAMLDVEDLNAIIAAASGGAEDPEGKRKKAIDDIIKAKKLRIRGGPYSG